MAEMGGEGKGHDMHTDLAEFSLRGGRSKCEAQQQEKKMSKSSGARIVDMVGIVEGMGHT